MEKNRRLNSEEDILKQLFVRKSDGLIKLIQTNWQLKWLPRCLISRGQ